MMVAYHAVYDIDTLSPGSGPDPFTGIWKGLQLATGSLFLGLAGLSLAVADGRDRGRGLGYAARARRRLPRIGQVAVAAVAVTLVTRLALDERYVRFGVLHCIAVSLLIALALSPLRAWCAVPGAGVIALGAWLSTRTSDTPGLAALGVPPDPNPAVDYYPLAPWAGAVLIGFALGCVLYPQGRRGRWSARLARAPAWAPAAGLPGRHSLLIYLVHQPVLLALIALLIVIGGGEVSLSDL